MSRHKALFATASALLLLGALSGCATLNRCGLGVCPDDAKITTDVEARLRQDAVTASANSIYVSTTNHVVYLNGIVDTRGEKARAETDARETAGVTDVVNGIVGHFP
jgi:osmotically-inducible protein OsmY